MPESFTDSPILGDRFEAALRLTVDHHRRQLRKGTQIPYPAHLLAVAALVLEMDGDEDEAIGALLHDMVEDGGGPPALAQIKREFGDRVAAIVRANSDSDELPKPPWRARKEAYIAGVAGKEPSALRVSLADKLHNARAILADYRVHGEALWDRFGAPDAAAVCWYYRELRNAFWRARERIGVAAYPAIEELGRTVDELERLVSRSAPPSLETGWVQDVLPTLTDAQAHDAFEQLSAAGHDPALLRGLLGPFLPRLANTYLAEPAHADLVALDPPAGRERVAIGDLGDRAAPDVLAGAVSVVAEAMHDGDDAGEALLCLNQDGVLRMIKLLDDESPPAWRLAEVLRDADVDRFALLTRRFGDLHLLLGCSTGRHDALLSRARSLPGGEPARTRWRDEALPDAQRLLRDIIDACRGTAVLPRLYLQPRPQPGHAQRTGVRPHR